MLPPILMEDLNSSSSSSEEHTEAVTPTFINMESALNRRSRHKFSTQYLQKHIWVEDSIPVEREALNVVHYLKPILEYKGGRKGKPDLDINQLQELIPANVNSIPSKESESSQTTLSFGEYAIIESKPTVDSVLREILAAQELPLEENELEAAAVTQESRELAPTLKDEESAAKQEVGESIPIVPENSTSSASQELPVQVVVLKNSVPLPAVNPPDGVNIPEDVPSTMVNHLELNNSVKEEDDKQAQDIIALTREQGETRSSHVLESPIKPETATVVETKAHTTNKRSTSKRPQSIFKASTAAASSRTQSSSKKPTLASKPDTTKASISKTTPSKSKSARPPLASSNFSSSRAELIRKSSKKRTGATDDDVESVTDWDGRKTSDVARLCDLSLEESNIVYEQLDDDSSSASALTGRSMGTPSATVPPPDNSRSITAPGGAKVVPKSQNQKVNKHETKQGIEDLNNI